MHIILIISYLFSSLSGAVYFTYVWQLKEYRLDRMVDGMSTKSGCHRVFSNAWIIKGLSLLVGAVHYFFAQEVDIFYFYAVSAFGFEFLEFCVRVYLKRVYRPQKTAKAMAIVAITFLLMVLLGVIFAYTFSMGAYALPVKELLAMLLGRLGLILLILSFFVAAINSIVVFAFNPITAHMKRKVILDAKRKLAANKIKVIGITGSYGKSSTKEFLYQILDSHFPGKVFKTPGNTNVDIGVAQEILKGLKKEHEYAIIEMGAYKKGEIKAICDLVHPTIGVVTAVSDQHLALFGSLQNIQDAKYELIESLPEDGIGFFNADSQGAKELMERLSGKNTVSYACEGTAKLMALHVDVKERSIDFDIHGIKFTANVFGKQNLPNLLAAIGVAKECGMAFQEIARAVRKIEMPDKIMNLKDSVSRKNLLVIDDSYNANPEGVRAALEYMRNFKGRKKILVFPGMMELGPKTDIEHIGVGELIAEICDFTVFTSSDFLRPLLMGLRAKGGEDGKYAVSGSAQDTFQLINEYVKDEQVVILFESRGSESVMKELLK